MRLLPDHDPHDAVFRLTVAGWSMCAGGRCSLDAGDVFFAVDDAADGLAAGDASLRGVRRGAWGSRRVFSCDADGLFCSVHKRPSAAALSAESLALAMRMLRMPLEAFAGDKLARGAGAGSAAVSGAVAGAAPGAAADDGRGADAAEVKSVSSKSADSGC